MSRGKKILSIVSRQFLTRNCPRPNCLLKCLPNCLSPTREGFFSFFQNCPRGEGNRETIERQKLSRAIFAPRHQDSGTKKEPKPKLLSPDIFWWGGGLPRERVGAKKFGMSLETQGIKLFWRDIPGYPGSARKV